MKITIIAVFALGAGLSLCLPAAAEKGKGPCAADAAKFCQDIKPGGGRIITCLKEHEAELSAECKAKGLEAKEKARGLAEACKSDLAALCKDVKGGHGEKLSCLKEHEAELSEGCKADFAKRKEELAKKSPCLADVEKFCKDAEAGKGGIMTCLKAHEAELSEACKAKQAEKKENRKARKKEKREHSGGAKGGDGEKP